jgi:hypothetical protein
MLISYSHKFLFVHLYKTAGNSIVQALEPYAYRPDSWRPSTWLPRLTVPSRLLLRENLPKHISAADLKAAIPAEIFNPYFKFAFVRNPWDWQVSLYHYILDHPENPTYPLVKRLGSFEAYMHWRATDYRTQTSQLCDAAGNLLVDFVGRIESIEQDFREICDRIGVKARLEHHNRSNHRHYRECYTDETRAIAAEIYAVDIERFGYSF